MNKRPWSVTIVGWLFVLVGVADFVSGVAGIKPHRPFPYDALWPLGLGIIAIVCGLFILRRHNWARWLAVAWLAFHVALSVHALRPLIMHTLLLAIFAYLLFRPAASAYFRATPPDPA